MLFFAALAGWFLPGILISVVAFAIGYEPVATLADGQRQSRSHFYLSALVLGPILLCWGLWLLFAPRQHRLGDPRRMDALRAQPLRSLSGSD